MFCKFCGKTLEDGSVFCKYCGKRLNVPAQQAYAPPPPRQTAKPKRAGGFIALGLAVAALIGAILFGLSKFGVFGGDDALVGRWSVSEVEYQGMTLSIEEFSEIAGRDVEIAFDFKPDGKVTVTGLQGGAGTYEVDGERVDITIDGSTQTFAFEGGTLAFETQGVRMVMEKGGSGASGDGDDGDDSNEAQPIASARKRQTPDATQIPTPDVSTPSPAPNTPTPTELGATFPVIFQRLSDISQTTNAKDYAKYDLTEAKIQGGSYRYFTGMETADGFNWHYGIDLFDAEQRQFYGATHLLKGDNDALLLASIFSEGYALLSAQFGEASSITLENVESSAPVPSQDDLIREFQYGGDDIGASVKWNTAKGETALFSVRITESIDYPTIGFYIDRRADAPAASATPAAPDTPAPTAKPTPAPSNSLAGTSWRTKIGSERGFDIYTELQFFKDGTYYEIMYTYYESDGGYSFESTIVGTYSVSGNRLSLSGEGRSADGGILGSPAPYSAEYFISRTDDGRGMMLSYDEGYRGVEYTAAKPRFDWREHLARALR